MTREQWEQIINTLAAGDFTGFEAAAHIARLHDDEWYRYAVLRGLVRRQCLHRVRRKP
jgi:hypothetical protein